MSHYDRPVSHATILFVCTGNICRSAFAERLASALVSELPAGHPARGWRFASAGISGLDGWPMCPEMAAELEERGGSAHGFTAQQLTASLVREAGLILALEPVHRTWILDEWPALVRRTWLLGHAARMAPELDGSGGLVEALRHHGGRARPEDGIADPYRRGPAAAARAAAAIEDSVRALLGSAVQLVE